MPLKIVWAADARRDLREIVTYVAHQDLPAAERLEQRIRNCAERIAILPNGFRHGRVPGTREAAAHPNYLLIYVVVPDRVRMLRVLHARRRYP